MGVDDELISITERPDARVDVGYDGELILVKAKPPETKFRRSALRILIERRMSELGDDEHHRYYRHSEIAHT